MAEGFFLKGKLLQDSGSELSRVCSKEKCHSSSKESSSSELEGSLSDLRVVDNDSDGTEESGEFP